MTGDNGQISAELLFLFGTLIIVLMISIVFISDENELNIAMAAAHSGVIEGLATSSSGIYPADAYSDYSNSKMNVLEPYSVEIVNISYTELGGDNNYDKKQIQFMVKTMLNMKEIPKPDDAADALAIAMCHGQSNKKLMQEN